MLSVSYKKMQEDIFFQQQTYLNSNQLTFLHREETSWIFTRFQTEIPLKPGRSIIPQNVIGRVDETTRSRKIPLARSLARVSRTSVNWIIKAGQVWRIDAPGLANCGVVNNRDDPAVLQFTGVARKRVAELVDVGNHSCGSAGSAAGSSVECSLNKQIPKRTHYLRRHRVAGSAADAWRTGSVGYISSCGINGGDFR